MLESELQSQVVSLCKQFGWGHYHTHNSRRSVKGFPDLVLWRESVMFVELKQQKGVVSPDQEVVLAGLERAGAEVWVWRPSDLPQIAGRLARPRLRAVP